MFKPIKPKEIISKNLKILLYGESGNGKTYLAGSCNNAIILDLEKGSASVMNENIDVIPIDNAGKFKKALEWVKEESYDTIIIDSLTRYGEMLYIALTQIYPDKKDSMLLWNQFDIISRQRLESILSINKNIIVTMLEENANDGGILKKFPMYKANKFKMMIPSYFDFVGHIVNDENNKRLLISVATDNAIGKNRLTKFGIKTIINQDDDLYNLQNIINKIKGV